MGFLTVISETGMFHSACLFEIGTPPRCEWRGFHPRAHRTPVGAGEVDRSNREAFINHYARFAVADGVLLSVLGRVDAGWADAVYALGVQDCVSLSAEVARQCGLSVPAVNMTPYGLLWALRTWNTCVNWDTQPYPWRQG